VDKFQQAMAQYNLNAALPLGISIGFAVRTDLEQTMDDAVRKADNNMYLDKAMRKKAASHL